MPRPALALAIEKLACAGERAGLSVEDMIRMLNAGVSVETLIDLVVRLHAFRESTLISGGYRVAGIQTR